MSIVTTVTLWIEIVLLLSLRCLCRCPRVHVLQASNEMIPYLLYGKTRRRRSFCRESHVLLIPLFLSLLLRCLMMHRLTLWPLPSSLPFFLSISAKEPSVQSPCSRLFPQMPPSLWEYQINEIDLSFLVIHQLLCLFHACPKYIQECPATLIPVDQLCNIHFLRSNFFKPVLLFNCCVFILNFNVYKCKNTLSSWLLLCNYVKYKICEWQKKQCLSLSAQSMSLKKQLNIRELIKKQSKTTWSYSYTWKDNFAVLRRVVKERLRVNNDLHVLIWSGQCIYPHWKIVWLHCLEDDVN